MIKKQISIQNLIEDLELDVTKIAIEKNYEIVAPENFSSEILDEKDKIEIVCFIGGG